MGGGGHSSFLRIILKVTRTALAGSFNKLYNNQTTIYFVLNLIFIITKLQIMLSLILFLGLEKKSENKQDSQSKLYGNCL